MYKTVLSVLIVLFLSACSALQERSVSPSQKAFSDEDTYILFALRAEQIHDNKSASELFMQLYAKSDKREYLYRSLENDIVAKSYEKVLKRVDLFLIDFPDDAQLIRLKIVALFDLNRLDEASILATKLASRTKEPNDYLLASDIYIKRQEFDMAVKYLESAYAKGNNEKILDKLSIVLYVNLGRKKDAIAHLETHSRMLGCSDLICARLIGFYSNDNNIEGLLSTYLRIYELHKSSDVAKKIIQIYSYKRDYMHLVDFLEKSQSDDKILLQLYSSLKKYDKAYVLADKLYSETSDIDYLAQSAIFEYESAQDKYESALLSRVVSKLEKVVHDEDSEAIYLNYLGYILIDHDIDVKKGMKYVEKVLQQQPNSAFYLDSKAWGYYKLGRCKEAHSLMQRVSKLNGGDNEEVLSHMREIDACIKKDKGRK